MRMRASSIRWPSARPVIGLASGVGRSGAILAPILIGALVSLKLPLEQNFMAIGLAGLMGAIAVMLINHRLSASTHHYDATKGAEQVRAASVIAGIPAVADANKSDQ